MTSDQTAVTTMDDLTGLAVVHVAHPTKPNAAALLGVSSATAWRMSREGTLHTIKIGRGGRRVPVTALLRLVEADLEPVPISDQDVHAGQSVARDAAALSHVTSAPGRGA